MSREPRLEAFALLTEEERGALGEGYEDAYPMSALQAGMVFHTQLEQFNGIYHDIMAEHVKCPWDRACFEQALRSCVREHPILRTGFRLDGDRPLQHVYASVELPLEVEDLRGQSAEEQDAYLAQWIEARKRHVFDWERGPLFHIHIFRRTDESFEFVLSFHHAVLDGWSRAVLTTTLYNRYESLLSGRALEPASVDWTYRDFIAQEQRALDNPAAKAYFAAMLEDAPAEQLPRLKSPGLRGPGAGRGRAVYRLIGTLDRAGEAAGSACAVGAVGGPLQSVVNDERSESGAELRHPQRPSGSGRGRAEPGSVPQLAATALWTWRRGAGATLIERVAGVGRRAWSTAVIRWRGSSRMWAVDSERSHCSTTPISMFIET